MDELLAQLEREISNLEPNSRTQSAQLDRLARKALSRVYDPDRQKYSQREFMFWMVFVMTIVTYLVVLVVLTSQLVDFSVHFVDLFDGELKVPYWQIEFESLSNQRLLIVLTGFLAELLLLPKIILKGLFGSSIDK